MFASSLMEQVDWVSPPGETILSALEERELTLEEFAEKIGRSAATAQRILDGSHVIDPKLARRLAEAVGGSENFWLAREYDYRTSLSSSDKIHVRSLHDLIDRLPLGDMRRFGWIKETKSKHERITEALSFFGVSSLAQWQGRYGNTFQSAAYRRSTTRASCEVSVTAWLRQGEIETQHDEVGDWSPSILKEQIRHFRRLTWYKCPNLFLPKLKGMLAIAGVKFAVVRAPKGCSASGAVRILAHNTPHIQLSFRYLSDDQFWFSLFHEIAHLLLHFERMPILEDGDVLEDQYEQEANEYASRMIVPMEHHDEMLSLGASKYSIISFAKKVGVAPGLIVGQLQHEGVIRFSQMQHLKRRFNWAT